MAARHDLLVGVVNVWSSVVARLLLGCASSCEVGVRVVADESPGAPVQPLVVVGELVAEENPLAALVLSVTAAVIDHYIEDGAYSLGL